MSSRIHTRRLAIILAFCVLQISACHSAEEHIPTTEPAMDAIDISEVKVILPQAGNVALVETNCVPCHSLRYIEMQPPLTHKAWEKIVDKMITAYGAPVRDSQTRNDIINYLWAIKKKE